MLSCNCTPIESCFSASNNCGGGCGDSPSASPSASPPICTKPNWSMYDLNSCEHRLFQSNICEITDIQGWPIEYRRLLTKDDYLFGEDPNSNLSYPSVTKCIYTPETETSILEMFGLTADDTLQYMIIPKAIFTRDLTTMFHDIAGPSASHVFTQPSMGDVITTLWNNRHYEISSIDEESNVFMGKKYTWDLILRPYRFSEQSRSHREVHTGFPDDPFESIVSGGYEPPIHGEIPDIIEHNYLDERFGDDKNIEKESNTIYDYPDPDERAFGN